MGNFYRHLATFYVSHWWWLGNCTRLQIICFQEIHKTVSFYKNVYLRKNIFFKKFMGDDLRFWKSENFFYCCLFDNSVWLQDIKWKCIFWNFFSVRDQTRAIFIIKMLVKTCSSFEPRVDVMRYLLRLELMHSDWLKLVTWLATSNHSALFQSRSEILLTSTPAWFNAILWQQEWSTVWSQSSKHEQVFVWKKSNFKSTFFTLLKKLSFWNIKYIFCTWVVVRLSHILRQISWRSSVKRLKKFNRKSKGRGRYLSFLRPRVNKINCH